MSTGWPAGPSGAILPARAMPGGPGHKGRPAPARAGTADAPAILRRLRVVIRIVGGRVWRVDLEGESTLTDRITIPVLPLRDVVLFPGVTAPIGAGRPMTIKAIEAALASPDKMVFAVAQRENIEGVTPDGLYAVGTIARIGQLQRGMSGMQLLLHGERRAMTIHLSEEHGHLVAVVRPLEDMPPVSATDASFVALHKELRARSAELGREIRAARRGGAAGAEWRRRTRPVADLVARYLDLDAAQRQELLGTLAVDERLRRVPRARPAPDRGARRPGRHRPGAGGLGGGRSGSTS